MNSEFKQILKEKEALFVKKALKSHGFPDEIVGAKDTKIYEVGSELDGSMIVDIGQ